MGNRASLEHELLFSPRVVTKSGTLGSCSVILM